MTRVVSFSGPDGCGKTTLIAGVRQELEARGVPVSYVWLRFNHYATRVFHGFCRLTGYTRYETHNGMRVGYHEFYRSRVVSGLAIAFNLVDTFLATLWCVYLPWLGTRRVILCDRWVFDIVVDMAVDTRKSLLPMPCWAKAFLALVPRSAACFMIRRDHNAVNSSRPLHAFDRNYLRRQEMFEAMARHPRVTAVTNDHSVDEAVREILAHLQIGATS